jgi:hypothetical protein
VLVTVSEANILYSDIKLGFADISTRTRNGMMKL